MVRPINGISMLFGPKFKEGLQKMIHKFKKILVQKLGKKFEVYIFHVLESIGIRLKNYDI